MTMMMVMVMKIMMIFMTPATLSRLCNTQHHDDDHDDGGGVEDDHADDDIDYKYLVHNAQSRVQLKT